MTLDSHDQFGDTTVQSTRVSAGVTQFGNNKFANARVNERKRRREENGRIAPWYLNPFVSFSKIILFGYWPFNHSLSVRYLY